MKLGLGEVFIKSTSSKKMRGFEIPCGISVPSKTIVFEP